MIASLHGRLTDDQAAWFHRSEPGHHLPASENTLLAVYTLRGEPSTKGAPFPPFGRLPSHHLPRPLNCVDDHHH